MRFDVRRPAAESAGALTREGHDLYDRGDAAGALTRYESALTVGDPAADDRFKLFVACGNCHDVLGNAAAAEAAYRKALLLDPDCAPAHWNLRDLYRRTARPALAEVHELALTRLVEGPALRLRRALEIPVIAPDREAIESWSEAFLVQLASIAATAQGEIRLPETELNATSLYLAYLGRPELEAARSLAATVRRFYPVRTTLPAPPPLRARIRVGFVSTFFRNHSIGRLYRGIIAGLDRTRFEVVVYSIGHGDDQTARAIAGAADRFVALPRHVPDIAAAITIDQPDVLYYPEIALDPVTYYLAFWRLAPLQCMSYGHPATSGIDTIDYFLSSDMLDAPADASRYSETLVRLPGFYMPAYERPSYVDTSASFVRLGVPAGVRVYFCSQTLIKFHPDFDAALSEILVRDESAWLVLIEGSVPAWRATLAARFEVTLAACAERVLFIPQQSTADYFTLLRQADCVLDTFHFGAGISAMDTFAAGVPLVTLEGGSFRGRQAAACLRELGVTECVARDVAHYVAIALRLAADRDWRVTLAARIRANGDQLFGRREACDALQDFLVEAVARARAA